MADQVPASVNVLILCERECQHELFRSLFNLSGLQVELRRDAQEFYAQLERQLPEVILVVAGQAEDSALAHVARLRQPGSAWRDIPVIVIFPEGTTKELTLSSLYQGAYDYLVEPFNAIELLTKVTVLARIKHAEDEFKRLAIRDVLTGLNDQRYLNLRLEEEMSRARRFSKPIACICLDIDNFSAVNDVYGAEAGDALLQAVADELRARKREIDVLARKDNDEFVLVLYNTDVTGAMILATRISDRLHRLEHAFDPGYHANVSLGLSALETSPELQVRGQELLHQAELALRKAKKSGGGRIVIYGE